MSTYVNRDSLARVWPELADPKKGCTLELQPGEEVDLDLPADFADPFLVLKSPAKAPKTLSASDASQAADPVSKAAKA